MYNLELTFDELNALKNYASSMVTGNRSTRVRDATTLEFWNNLNEKLLLASHHTKVGQPATESHAQATQSDQQATQTVDEPQPYVQPLYKRGEIPDPTYSTYSAEPVPPPVVWNEGNPNLVDSDQPWTHPDAEPHKQ